MYRNLKNIAILNMNGVYCRCIVNGVSKKEDVCFLKKIADLSKKLDYYKI